MVTAYETHNPMGTDGFEFLEFSSKNPEQLIELFKMSLSVHFSFLN